jgi:hypothetical protein
MDGLRDELFAREEEEMVVNDDGHVVTDGENIQPDSEAERAWDARAKLLKTALRARRTSADVPQMRG